MNRLLAYFSGDVPVVPPQAVSRSVSRPVLQPVTRGVTQWNVSAIVCSVVFVVTALLMFLY
jgi:hypothetical protein